MQNILFGIVTILACSLLYFFSWKSYRKEAYSTSLLLITLSGFLLLAFTASDLFLHVWDERYHALVAKNFMKHPFLPTLYDDPILAYDYKNWVGNHIWVHKQPLPLWLMAGSMKLFGVNEIALRLPSVLMSTLGIVLTFQVGRFFFSKKVGLLAAFFFSVNGLIIELTSGRISTDHVDIAFLFFILLSIYFITVFLKRKSIIFTVLIGFCIGGTVLTKWLTGLIVVPIWMLLVFDQKPLKMKYLIGHFFVLLVTIIAVALPWQLYIFKEFPLEATYESEFNLRHFTELIEDRAGSALYFVNQIRINYGELIYLPIVWFFWTVFKSPRELKKWALFIWFVLPLFVFSVAKTKMQGYLLFTAPALFIVTSAFFFELNNYQMKRNPKWFYRLTLALFILLPIRYAIERIKPFENRDRNPQWVQDLKTLNKKKIEKGILFNYENPIEAMFYTDLTVYSTIPSQEKMDELRNRGYQLFINQSKNAARDIEIKEKKGAKITKLSVAKE